ncbi:hypothetical protein HDE_10362 [Halotydeus destructor]|nr:hypothetical protein HDE_10362 [Halotydeus destructor]
MEVEVTSPFLEPAQRSTNFVVLKFFLLGMLISNGIESILIVPKTLSMMDDNEEKVRKLDLIYVQHDAFKAQLDEYSQLVDTVRQEEHQDIEKLSQHNVKQAVKGHNKSHPAASPGHHKAHRPRKVIIPAHKKDEQEVDTNRVVEVSLLVYGLLTLGLGIFSVFKENAKLLLVFIGVVALGLIMLFFSGLTLLVFMAVLNDIIIALISFKYYQMLISPVVDSNPMGSVQQTQYMEAAYNPTTQANYR